MARESRPHFSSTCRAAPKQVSLPNQVATAKLSADCPHPSLSAITHKHTRAHIEILSFNIIIYTDVLKTYTITTYDGDREGHEQTETRLCLP